MVFTDPLNTHSRLPRDVVEVSSAADIEQLSQLLKDGLWASEESSDEDEDHNADEYKKVELKDNGIPSHDRP